MSSLCQSCPAYAFNNKYPQGKQRKQRCQFRNGEALRYNYCSVIDHSTIEINPWPSIAQALILELALQLAKNEKEKP